MCRDLDIEGIVKFGGGSLMFWGCMMAEDIGYGCKIEGKMDSILYHSILGDELLETIDYFKVSKENIIFQHDNAPPHTAKKIREWFGENDIHVLQWPAQSPDLNPIENLQAYLKKKLAEYEKEPEGMLELWERVQKEWSDIPRELCSSLVKGMRKRLRAVLKAKGGYTRY